MDDAAFAALVAPHRAALHAHCYRMLGSTADADDALQDALLGAWKGRATFAGRSTLRAWLFKIATNASLALIARRKSARVLAEDYGPAAGHVATFGDVVADPVWIEPYPTPTTALERKETLELAFIAALQQLPAIQRAVLLLRDVLAYSADETAAALDTSTAAVTSALQRARARVASRVPARSQAQTLRELGEAGQRELVTAYVTAFERGDVEGFLALLTDDATFAMPPLPQWFAGPAGIRHFLTDHLFQRPWKLRPTLANGQLAFACYHDGPLAALNVITVRGTQIAGIVGFLDPAIHARFSLAAD